MFVCEGSNSPLCSPLASVFEIAIDNVPAMSRQRIGRLSVFVLDYSAGLFYFFGILSALSIFDLLVLLINVDFHP